MTAKRMPSKSAPSTTYQHTRVALWKAAKDSLVDVLALHDYVALVDDFHKLRRVTRSDDHTITICGKVAPR